MAWWIKDSVERRHRWFAILQLIRRIELLYRAILMETDNNSSDVVISQTVPFKSFRHGVSFYAVDNDCGIADAGQGLCI
jgi:hypothetical protein